MNGNFADMFLEAMRYEHWLRFYFLADAEVPMQASADSELAVESMDAVIAVPADIAARSRTEEPRFVSILDALQGQIVSMERSRDAVFHWLGEQAGVLPGTAEFEACMAALSGDMEFRRKMDGFHGWVQELANNAIDLKGNALPPGAPSDERIPDFTEWDKAFQFWFSLQKPLGEISPSI